jgi:DNA gyrase/topoisomerase IV subunit B
MSTKFVHALNAGKKNNCTLFICEGDSAKNFVIAMLDGDNKNYGYLALKGKIMNFRKASLA